MAEPSRSVMWRNLDEPGTERAVVSQTRSGWYLTGTVLIALPEPTEVRYTIECDEAWRTRQVGVELTTGGEGAKLRLQADGKGGWLRGGLEPLDLGEGVLDVDLGVSPVTNTLPVRRLGLEIGQSASIAVAWVLFPSLDVARSVQAYERIDANTYRFTDDTFQADLEVDDFGLVVSYPGGWARV